MFLKFFKKKKVKKEDNKQYILNVITHHKDGGYSSHWHGWSSKWLFTYEEAQQEKEKIKDFYDEIELIEYYPEHYRISQQGN